MATIASLDIASSFDASGLQRGISLATKTLENFGRTANMSGAGMRMADDIIDGLTKTLLQKNAALELKLAGGLLSPEQFAAEGAKAAAEFKSGLAKGIGNMAVQGLVTDEIRQKFEHEFLQLAAASGIAFTKQFSEMVKEIDGQIKGLGSASTASASLAGLQQSEVGLQNALKSTTLTMYQRKQVTEQLDRVQDALSQSTLDTANAMDRTKRNTDRAASSAGLLGRFINRNTGEFTALGRRASGALVGISFALDGIVQGGGKAEASIHGILRTVASVAPAFGSEGLLVSAVAAGTDAIISLFTETRKQLDDTETAFRQSMQQMVDDANSSGLQQQLQDLERGKASAGRSLFGDFNTGGLSDLNAQLADAQTRLRAFESDASKVLAASVNPALKAEHDALVTQIAGLTKQIATLEQRRSELRAAIEARIRPQGGTGLLPETTVKTSIELLEQRVEGLVKLVGRANDEMLRLPRVAFQVVGEGPARTFRMVETQLDATQQHAQHFLDTFNNNALRTFDAVTASLARQKDQLGKNAVQLRQMQETLKQIAVVRILRAEPPRDLAPVHVIGAIDALIPPPKPTAIRLPAIVHLEMATGFDEIVRRLAAVQQARAAAEAIGDSAEAARRGQTELVVTQQLADAEQTILRSLIAAHAPASFIAQAMLDMRDALAKAGIDVSRFQELLSDSSGVSQLRAGAEAALSMGHALGRAGEDARAAFDAVDRLVTSAKGLKTAFSAGGSFADVAGGLAGVVSSVDALISLFGKSPAEREHDRILVENNQALAELSASLDRFGETAGSIQNVKLATAAVAGSGIPFGFPSDQPTDEARKILAKYGLTLEQVNKIAQDYGITLVENGRIVDGTFRQFQEALGISTDLLTKWSNSFDAQQRLDELARHAGLTGDTPADQLAATVQNIKEQLGPRFAGMLDSFDTAGELASADAREQLKKVIQQMVLAIQNGSITLEDIQGFKDVNEFGGALDAALTGLDAFNEGLNAVTDSLLNVPEIFKLARVRFESALPETPTTPGAPQGPPKVPTTVPPEPSVQIPPLVIDSLGRLPNVLATLPDSVAASTDRLGNALPSVMRDALDGATFGIRDQQFDALLEALRATVPAPQATDSGGNGGGFTIEGDVYVDARTKSVEQAWDETIALLRRRSRAGDIPLAGVRTQ